MFKLEFYHSKHLSHRTLKKLDDYDTWRAKIQELVPKAP